MYMLLLLGHFRVTHLAKQYKIKTKHFNQLANHCFTHLKGDQCEPAAKKTFSLKCHIYSQDNVHKLHLHEHFGVKVWQKKKGVKLK